MSSDHCCWLSASAPKRRLIRRSLQSQNATSVRFSTDRADFQVISGATRRARGAYRIPALYEWRECVTAGGLMSYSTDRDESGQKQVIMLRAFSRARSRPTCRL